MKLVTVMSKEAIDRDKKNLNVLIKSRICNTWEPVDTLSLPTSIYRKFLTYMQGEMNEWVEYDPEEAKKNTSAPLTSAKGK